MIEKKHLIRGAKGNDPPPAPPQPTRAPDTLHSKQFVTFLDLKKPLLINKNEKSVFKKPIYLKGEKNNLITRQTN